MPERNVDKVKRLTRELAEALEKCTAANVELGRQRGAVREAREGARQAGQVCDALLTATVLKFGAQVGAAAWELKLPPIDVLALVGEYRLEVSFEPGGELFHLRVEKRGSADGESV